ncbi:hypothetical protein B0H19DRAFT_1240137 [Mycena capillaripes]|nr:hypothetical protein B0H19DRAFT_1240137 [Mycena capillaripes]
MSRARRSKSQASAAAEGLAVLDKLVLAQAVYDVGPSSWLKISRILGKHPMLSHPKTFFTAQSCHAMYDHLMKEAGLELGDANNTVNAPTHLKLAEKYFAERIEELRTLIRAEEEQFKAIVAEIEQIRAGLRDEEIRAKITGMPAPDKEEHVQAEEDGQLEASEDIVPEQDVPAADAVSAAPGDEAPEIEMPVAEIEMPAAEIEMPAAEAETPAAEAEMPAAEVEMPAAEAETVQQEEPTPNISDVPPTPEAAMEDVAAQLEGTKASAETTPAPEAPPSPVENLDHLMQVSDDEKPPDAEVPDPIPEEQPVNMVLEQPPEEAMAPVQDAEPTADDVKSEPLDTRNDGDVAEPSQSKPVSRNSEASVVPESGPTAEESISTRRSTRRRPSISLVPVPAPVPVKKRGRGRPHKPTPEPEAEAEQESTPAPTLKEATPAVDEMQPEEDPPLSAAIRRRDSKRKASSFGVDSPRASKRPREESEPVDDDDQGSASAVRHRPVGRTQEQVALKRFQTVITMVHSQISQHRNGNIFHNPIKTSEAPDYHDIVKRPIDLKTIKAKIKDGVIGNSLEYQRDIYLMFANAMMYNRPGSDVHVMAEDMMVESDGHINTFRQTEGYRENPNRWICGSQDPAGTLADMCRRREYSPEGADFVDGPRTEEHFGRTGGTVPARTLRLRRVPGRLCGSFSCASPQGSVPR